MLFYRYSKILKQSRPIYQCLFSFHTHWTVQIWCISFFQFKKETYKYQTASLILPSINVLRPVATPWVKILKNASTNLGLNNKSLVKTETLQVASPLQFIWNQNAIFFRFTSSFYFYDWKAKWKGLFCWHLDS